MPSIASGTTLWAIMETDCTHSAALSDSAHGRSQWTWIETTLHRCWEEQIWLRLLFETVKKGLVAFLDVWRHLQMHSPGPTKMRSITTIVHVVHMISTGVLAYMSFLGWPAPLVDRWMDPPEVMTNTPWRLWSFWRRRALEADASFWRFLLCSLFVLISLSHSEFSWIFTFGSKVR